LTEEDRIALAGFAEDRHIGIAIQPGGPDSVSWLAGPAELVYSLPEFAVDIRFDATDFVQVNAAVNRLMVSRVLQLLDLEAHHRVLDLYCGIANFSLPLARRSAHVLGVEGEARQVLRAAENAARNGIDNCAFRQSDLAGIDGSERWLADGWDRLLLDPARSGAQAVVERAASIGAPRIVYVSCHPGTLARDAGILVNERGYRLEAAGIIDMFPHTGHVESLAVFQKD
jgi:23S rRNA (uracil1939-C5)-methyltransferase